MVQRVARGLPEAVIERSAAGAADLIEDAVEDTAAALVLVESLIEEMAQEPPGLRDAPAHRPAQPRRGIAIALGVLQEADEIARAGEADANDTRARGPVDDVVDAAGLEAALERDRLLIDELPFLARDQRRRIEAAIAHRHPVLSAQRIDDGVGLVAAIGEPLGRAARAGNEIAAHEPGDRLAVIGRDGHVHAHAAVRHVPLPSHPRQREALIHQRAVAEFGGCGRIGGARRALECDENPLGAAIAGLVEQPAVAARGIDGLQQIEVGAHLDAPARVARREREIDDALVLRKIRIQLDDDRADDLFVRPRGAERLAAEYDLTPRDLEPRHVRPRRRRPRQQRDPEAPDHHASP